MIQQAVFLVLAAVSLGGALGVVTSRSVFVSALWLIFSFIGVAGLYVLLQAGFLAVVQLLIYVGAISVLILFVVMLTRQVMGGERLNNSQWYLAAVVSAVVFVVLGVLNFRTDWPLQPGQVLPASGGSVVIATTEGGEGLSRGEAAMLPGAVVEKDESGQAVIRVPGTIAMLGRAFVTDYMLPFEVISAILLVALVGAVIIARE